MIVGKQKHINNKYKINNADMSMLGIPRCSSVETNTYLKRNRSLFNSCGSVASFNWPFSQFGCEWKCVWN